MNGDSDAIDFGEFDSDSEERRWPALQELFDLVRVVRACELRHETERMILTGHA